VGSYEYTTDFDPDGQSKFPRAARSDYDPSASMAKRAAASLSLYLPPVLMDNEIFLDG
jgi:hypothetical protein